MRRQNIWPTKRQRRRRRRRGWFSDLVILWLGGRVDNSWQKLLSWHWRLVRVTWTAFAILAMFHYNEWICDSVQWLSVTYLAVCSDSNGDCLKERNNWSLWNWNNLSQKLAFYHNAHRNKKSRHLAAMEEYGNETLPKGFWTQELLCKYWN